MEPVLETIGQLERRLNLSVPVADIETEVAKRLARLARNVKVPGFRPGKVPMQLLRAGVRLASLIPAQAHEQLDEALSKHGVPITLSQIKPENLEELIDHLEDLRVDVEGTDGNATKVRVFCE